MIQPFVLFGLEWRCRRTIAQALNYCNLTGGEKC